MEKVTIKTLRKPQTLFKISHKLHKWLMLFIGVQFVIWSVTGAYMVFFDIDYIHGDSLIINHQTKIKPENLTYSTQKLFQQYPKAENLSVGMLVNREVYRFNIDKQAFMVDASDGKLLSPLDEQSAIVVAEHFYADDGEIINAELITENPPFELSSRHLPAWRVNFDNFAAPALYISASTGKVVTKRHEFWRLFDWMFRFHVMDYDDGGNVSNWFLFIIALLAQFAALSGLVLTYFKVIKPAFNNNKKRSRKATLTAQDKPLNSGGES